MDTGACARVCGVSKADFMYVGLLVGRQGYAQKAQRTAHLCMVLARLYVLLGCTRSI